MESGTFLDMVQISWAHGINSMGVRVRVNQQPTNAQLRKKEVSFLFPMFSSSELSKQINEDTCEAGTFWRRALLSVDKDENQLGCGGHSLHLNPCTVPAASFLNSRNSPIHSSPSSTFSAFLQLIPSQYVGSSFSHTLAEIWQDS